MGLVSTNWLFGWKSAGRLASGIALALAALTGPAHATVSFSASSGTLSATVTFATISNDLQITLTNTSTTTTSYTPSDLLSGLFFDIAGDPVLTAVSATVAAGSVINGSSCSPGPCNSSTTNVGGEFRFEFSSSGFTGATSSTYGIAAAGYSSLSPTFGGGPNFNGSVLNSPSLGGVDFSLAGSDYNFATANGGAQVPLIQNTATLVLAGLPNGFALSSISAVSFGYGTAPDLVLTGTATKIPEPASFGLLGAGLIGLVYARRRIS